MRRLRLNTQILMRQLRMCANPIGAEIVVIPIKACRIRNEPHPYQVVASPDIDRAMIDAISPFVRFRQVHPLKERPITAHANEVPASLEFFAFESEGEIALLEALMWVAFRKPATAIPDQYGAGAILAFRDSSFECVVINRVILDLDCEALGAGDEARPFGHRPALITPSSSRRRS